VSAVILGEVSEEKKRQKCVAWRLNHAGCVRMVG